MKLSNLENNQISSEEIIKLINNKDLLKINISNPPFYTIVSKNIQEIIKENRLDIFYKVLFLKLRTINKKLANKIYYENIKLLSVNSFKENNKKSFKDFLKKFIALEKELIKNEELQYLIPLSENNTFSDGAHRLSILINNKSKAKIKCVQFKIKPLNFNYNYFKTLNANKEILEMSVLEYLKFKKNIKIAFIWPSSNLGEKEINNYFKNIIYIKDLDLNYNGRLNLINIIYSNEKWLGNKNNNFIGSKTKISNCFVNDNNLKIIFFHNSDNEFIKIKEKIRDHCKVGKHSIHSIDGLKKTHEISNFILNKHCEQFLNNSTFLKQNSTLEKLIKIENFITKNNINKNDILITSSFILELFGFRRSEDIDYLTNTKLQNDNIIKTHIHQMKYYEKSMDDLIYNSNNYFYFRNIKFISLNNLKIFKNNRYESKDINDLEKINNFLKKNEETNKIYHIYNQIIFFNIRIYYSLRMKIVILSKKIGIYFFLKKMFIR
jgi:hypothetical protein